MISEIEDYFSKGCGRCARFDTAECSTRRWRTGLGDLRRICVKAGLYETVRWGHPCYTHAGRNIALIGAFRDDFRLSFMNAALLSDPEGLLERPGPNTRHANLIRFTENKQVAGLEPVLLGYLAEAMGFAAAGIRAPKSQSDIDLPGLLVEALDADPELAEAFHALTPGRQRSYVIALTSAKKPQTQIARIARFRSFILAGKGANER